MTARIIHAEHRFTEARERHQERAEAKRAQHAWKSWGYWEDMNRSLLGDD